MVGLQLQGCCSIWGMWFKFKADGMLKLTVMRAGACSAYLVLGSDKVRCAMMAGLRASALLSLAVTVMRTISHSPGGSVT